MKQKPYILLSICGEKSILTSFWLYVIPTVFFQAENAKSSGFFRNPTFFFEAN